MPFVHSHWGGRRFSLLPASTTVTAAVAVGCGIGYLRRAHDVEDTVSPRPLAVAPPVSLVADEESPACSTTAAAAAAPANAEGTGRA